MNIKKDIRFRVYVAFTAICLLGAAIVGKAAFIQYKRGPELRKDARKQHTRTDTLRAERGAIYSEDGTLLSSSIPEFDVHLDLTITRPDSFHRYRDTLGSLLSGLLGRGTPAQWTARLAKAYGDSTRYLEIGKKIPYHQYQTLRTFPIFNRGQRYGGVIVDAKEKRINPYGMLAARTLGKSNFVWKGTGEEARLVKSVAGLEATCDSILSGTDGIAVKQRAVGGRWVTLEGSVVEPQDGRDIVTTLDLGMQTIAENALLSVLEKYNCERGTCIVMEVATGKIKALANVGLDPKTGEYGEWENYALVQADPGSVFKMATLLALSRDGLLNVEDLVNCEGGSKDFGSRTMHDSHHGAGTMPIREAFAQSSNVGMAKLAVEHYYKEPEKFVAHLKALHLLDKTGIELAGEYKPTIIAPGTKYWQPIILPWLATGYHVTITPLHTAMLYNAVANGGKMMKPYLIHAVREHGRDVHVTEPVVLEEAITDSAAVRQLRACVEEVVLSGTGKHIQSPFYQIAGKTGTAQVADPAKGITYRMGVYQGTFVGYFPADKPKYTVCCVIRTRPHAGTYYGGTLAAPVVRMVADKIFASTSGSWGGPLDSLSRISKGRMPAAAAPAARYDRLLGALGRPAAVRGAAGSAVSHLSVDTGTRAVRVEARHCAPGTVPDVHGAGVRDAVYLLEKAGLTARISGSGTVASQSIPPGTPVRRGDVVVLQLGAAGTTTTSPKVSPPRTPAAAARKTPAPSTATARR